MLDTHQLHVFLTAAETLSFTEAARRLHMSQPSVSQHIQALERHFDRELFVRAGRSIILTDAGRALMPMARDIVNYSNAIEETMHSLDGEVHGRLLLGCSTTVGKYLLPSLLARFHREYPKIKVFCQVASPAQAMDMLCANEIHFSLTSAPAPTCRDMEVRKYATDAIVLIAPNDHPWAKRGIIAADDLRDGYFILREPGSGTMAAVYEGLAGAGVGRDELEAGLVLGNPEAVALAVEEGLGVGFVSSLVVDKLVPEGVTVVDIRGLNLERDITIGRYAGRSMSGAQIAFWDFVREEAQVSGWEHHSRRLMEESYS